MYGHLRQPDPFDRQTLIALRARRQAYRLARDLIDPPMDLCQFYCRHCGRPLVCEALDVNDHIRCGRCGVRTLLPPGAAARVRQRSARASPHRSATSFRDSLSDAAVFAYLVLAIILMLTAI